MKDNIEDLMELEARIHERDITGYILGHDYLKDLIVMMRNINE